MSFGWFITRRAGGGGFMAGAGTLPAGAATIASRKTRKQMTKRPTDQVIGTGYRAIALVLSLKDRLLEKGVDPTKLVAQTNPLLEATAIELRKRRALGFIFECTK
jgi:hypothetical protein